MDSKDITKIALKVFSIYVMTQAILVIPSFFQAYVMLSNGSEYNSAQWFSAISIVAILLLVILSVFIWKLSTNTTAQTKESGNSLTNGLSETFFLSLLGLYLIFNGLFKFSLASVGIYYAMKASADIDYDASQHIIVMGVFLVQILIGLTLIIKSNGWLALLNKLRVAGTH